MAEIAPRLQPGRVVHHTSLGAIDVALPELRFGKVFLERWRVREQPAGFSWRQTAYRSLSPAVLSFRDATLFSTCGILLIGDFVIADTLLHADPAEHGFQDDGDRIAIVAGAERSLSGCHLMALCGSQDSYFHAMIDGVGRLAPIPEHLIASSATVVTASALPTIDAMVDRFCNDRTMSKTRIARAEAVRVPELVVSFNTAGQCNYHDCLVPFFTGLADRQASSHRSRPTRMIYIDRSSAQARRLLNEEDLKRALLAEGVEPVRLEELGLAQQLELFRNVGLVVAPHGAGLTNILFLPGNAVVLELLMDTYCNWSFRHLAALRRIRYDCVVGRAYGAWSDQPGAVHAMTWDVSVDHVVAAVRSLKDLRPA